MKVHFLHHMPLAIENNIDLFLKQKNHQIGHTYLYQGDSLPSMSEVDWLIIMGGSMSANDEQILPWLIPEKKFIKQVIDAEKTVLGICLGAQLVANVLGANIYANPHYELGWHEISISPEVKTTFLADNFIEKISVFHAHGETFDLPPGATKFAASEACANQGFIFKDHVLAIQFHPEINEPLAELFLSHCPDEQKDGAYVQTRLDKEKSQILFEQSIKFINSLLSQLDQRTQV